MSVWKQAKATGMASRLGRGMSGSHSEFESVTAMASIARATPRSTASTIAAEAAVGSIASLSPGDAGRNVHGSRF